MIGGQFKHHPTVSFPKCFFVERGFSSSFLTFKVIISYIFHENLIEKHQAVEKI